MPEAHHAKSEIAFSSCIGAERQQLRRREIAGDPHLDRDVLGQRLAVDDQSGTLCFGLSARYSGVMCCALRS